MTLESVHRSAYLFAGIFAMMVPTMASGQSPGTGFAMIGIAGGQSVRINALNLGTSSSTENSSCRVTLQFMDVEGRIVKQSLVTLGTGKSASLDISREALSGDDPRVEIRAVLLYGYSGGAPPPPGVLQRFDCGIVPSLEIYDNETGRTSVVLTDSRLLPGPATAAQ